MLIGVRLRLACEKSASAAAVTASSKGATDGSATATGATGRHGITVGCSVCAGVTAVAVGLIGVSSTSPQPIIELKIEIARQYLRRASFRD